MATQIAQAARVRRLNAALGTAMTPRQIAREIPDETIDILLDWTAD